jgi:hypothetical protein
LCGNGGVVIAARNPRLNSQKADHGNVMPDDHETPTKSIDWLVGVGVGKKLSEKVIAQPHFTKTVVAQINVLDGIYTAKPNDALWLK